MFRNVGKCLVRRCLSGTARGNAVVVPVTVPRPAESAGRRLPKLPVVPRPSADSNLQMTSCWLSLLPSHQHLERYGRRKLGEEGTGYLPLLSGSYTAVTLVPPLHWAGVPVGAPGASRDEEKRAARLIVIRRRKMKKHKLRKLRKRMKFEWAKVRQKREMRKEKAFRVRLIAQIKEGEAFDAVHHVAEKLRKAQWVPSASGK